MLLCGMAYSPGVVVRMFVTTNASLTSEERGEGFVLPQEEVHRFDQPQPDGV